jgi:large subunit ribosomal protein L15e
MVNAYSYLSSAWRSKDETYVKNLMKELLIKWRREPSVVRVNKPTRLDKARRLGYKAKQGFVIVRVKVRRGGARKARPRSGRRQKAMGVKKYTRAISLKKIAIERAARKFPNLTPLNAYWVWKDGQRVWFEVIMVDTHHPAIKNDEKIQVKS